MRSHRDTAPTDVISDPADDGFFAGRKRLTLHFSDVHMSTTSGEIVYYSALGYKHQQIIEKSGVSGVTVSKYRKKMRELSEEEAAEVFRLVAEIKSS